MTYGCCASCLFLTRWAQGSCKGSCKKTWPRCTSQFQLHLSVKLTVWHRQRPACTFVCICVDAVNMFCNPVSICSIFGQVWPRQHQRPNPEPPMQMQWSRHQMIRGEKRNNKLSPGKGPPEPCKRATPCKREIKRWLQLGPHSGMCDGKM